MSEGATTVETRYYISSLKVDAQKAFNAVKSHWAIENTLHWSLDMSYREDESRIRRQNGRNFSQSYAALALMLLKKTAARKPVLIWPLAIQTT